GSRLHRSEVRVPGAARRTDGHSRVLAERGHLAAARSGEGSLRKAVLGLAATRKRRAGLARGGSGRDHAGDRRAFTAGKTWRLQRTGVVAPAAERSFQTSPGPGLGSDRDHQTYRCLADHSDSIGTLY